MKISDYVKEYTSSGERILPRHILSEFREFFIELIWNNKAGMREEFGDTLHFIQLWLYWRFGLDGELWPQTKESTDKFMARQKIWRQLYREVGLSEDISRFCGNCGKVEKVVKHLAKFGVEQKRAEEAYNKIFGPVTNTTHK